MKIFAICTSYNPLLFFIFYPDQLWTAPELLRKYEEPGDLKGTREGDMYSFAIVCQEIIYRKSVFYRTDVTDPEVWRFFLYLLEMP